MSAADAAVMARYTVRLSEVEGLKAQAQAGGLKPDETQALGDYLLSLPKSDFTRENRRLLLNDPGTGVSSWVTENDITSAPTAVLRGMFAQYYSGTEEPARTAVTGR
jgi:hypothetical protein